MHGQIIADIFKNSSGESIILALDFLEAYHIRLCLTQPVKNSFGSDLDGIHVPACDLESHMPIPER
jgi:hypothetical protein